jgi:hypothetical protein
MMGFAASVSFAADDRADIPLLPPPGGGAQDFPNFVKVRVGSESRSADVLFDTGSIGLRVLKDYVGEDVEITRQRLNFVDPRDGTKLVGRLAYAKVSFPGTGGVKTPERVAFQVVEEVSCDRKVPDCPGWKKGQEGMMGVGFFGSRDEPIFSPLDQLDDPLSHGLVIDAISDDPSVRLGPVDSSHFDFAKLRPARNTPPFPRRPNWNTWTAKVCFQVGRDEKSCDPTLFDTGAADVRFWQTGARVKPDGTLQSGQRVSMELDGGFRLELNAGDRPWNNEFLVKEPSRDQYGANAGGQIFRRFVVAYDLHHGYVGFCTPEKRGLPAKVAEAKRCR